MATSGSAGRTVNSWPDYTSISSVNRLVEAKGLSDVRFGGPIGFVLVDTNLVSYLTEQSRFSYS